MDSGLDPSAPTGGMPTASPWDYLTSALEGLCMPHIDLLWWIRR